MLTYKRGDTIALVAPLLLNKVAQPGTGWSGFACMKLVGKPDAPQVNFAFAWAQTVPHGIARVTLDTAAVPEGQYETEVALRRDSDGFTLTSQTERINITSRVGALPALGA